MGREKERRKGRGKEDGERERKKERKGEGRWGERKKEGKEGGGKMGRETERRKGRGREDGEGRWGEKLFFTSQTNRVCHTPELQIRRGNRDNSEILLFYFSMKTYVVTPQ